MAANKPAPSNLDLLRDLELPLNISFGSANIPLHVLANLNGGSIVTLDRPVDDPVDVIVNDRVVARGEVVVVDGCYGVRILEIASAAQRLASARAEIAAQRSADAEKRR